MNKFLFIGITDVIVLSLVGTFFFNLIVEKEFLILGIFSIVFVPILIGYLKYRMKWWKGICC